MKILLLILLSFNLYSQEKYNPAYCKLKNVTSYSYNGNLKINLIAECPYELNPNYTVGDDVYNFKKNECIGRSRISLRINDSVSNRSFYTSKIDDLFTINSNLSYDINNQNREIICGFNARGITITWL